MSPSKNKNVENKTTLSTTYLKLFSVLGILGLFCGSVSQAKSLPTSKTITSAQQSLLSIQKAENGYIAKYHRISKSGPFTKDTLNLLKSINPKIHLDSNSKYDIEFLNDHGKTWFLIIAEPKIPPHPADFGSIPLLGTDFKVSQKTCSQYQQSNPFQTVQCRSIAYSVRTGFVTLMGK